MTAMTIRVGMRRLLVATAVIAAIWGGADVINATERKPLPSFQLQAADGHVTSSLALSAEEKWLIVVASPACPACDRLLEAIVAQQSEVAIARTVVIVTGDPDTLLPYIAGRREAAPSMKLYADLQRQAAFALGVTGTPAVVGIRRGQIEWAISGVLNDPAALEPAITAWLTY